MAKHDKLIARVAKEKGCSRSEALRWMLDRVDVSPLR